MANFDILSLRTSFFYTFQVKWDDRSEGSPTHGCFVSVDGTDSRISEPSPFSATWYSHKFHGAGLRYEVGLSISTGQIVWVNGAFP